MEILELLSCAVQLFTILWTVACLCSWDFPGKNTGVDCHSLLQGIFPTQGSNPGFPHSRQILYHLSHQRSPRILESIANPFSREIFTTQRLGLGLLHCWLILYHLSHQGSPRILEWVTHSFSRRISPPSNITGVSCIAGKFFIS